MYCQYPYRPDYPDSVKTMFTDFAHFALSLVTLFVPGLLLLSAFGVRSRGLGPRSCW